MRHARIGTALAATGIFAAGWLAGGGLDTRTAPVPIIASALAQADRPAMDPNMLAIAMGVASVAVDTEAAALRINDLTDRLAALERRVQAIEKR